MENKYVLGHTGFPADAGPSYSSHAPTLELLILILNYILCNTPAGARLAFLWVPSPSTASQLGCCPEAELVCLSQSQLWQGMAVLWALALCPAILRWASPVQGG